MEETWPRRRVGGWMAATLAACALFWGGLYLGWLQPLNQELGRSEAARAKAEQEMPTPQAERALAETEQELARLKGRWATTTAAGLGRELEAHGVTLLKAEPGDEAATFLLEVEGSAHGLGLALPELETNTPAPDGRWPPVLYVRRVKSEPRLRGRFRLEGVGRVSEWTTGPPPAAGK